MAVARRLQVRDGLEHLGRDRMWRDLSKAELVAALLGPAAAAALVLVAKGPGKGKGRGGRMAGRGRARGRAGR